MSLVAWMDFLEIYELDPLSSRQVNFYDNLYIYCGIMETTQPG